MSDKIMVLELAKEVGVAPLEFVKTVQGLGVEVKSHMSLLTEDEVSRIRDGLTKKKTTTKKKKAVTRKKKAVAKKKVAAKVATAKASTAKASAIVVEEDAAPKKKAAKKIIRRRAKKVEDEAPVVEEVESKEEVLEKVAQKAPDKSPEAEIQELATVAPSEEVVAKADKAEVQESDSKEATEETPKDETGLKYDEKGRPIAAGFIPKRGSKAAPSPKVVSSKNAAPPPSELSFRAKKVDFNEADAKAGAPAASKLKRGYLKEAIRTENELKMYDYRRAEIRFAPKKKRVMSTSGFKKTLLTKAKASKRVVKYSESLNLMQLAQLIGEKIPVLMKKLMELEMEVNQNAPLDFETVELLLDGYDFTLEDASFKEDELIKKSDVEETDSDQKPRNPVVTIMGHVDHGKTSLLDAIREANIADSEHGGITQHTSAYVVDVDKNHHVTFMDTPGHEAFAEMRSRGANLTDIVILVVAADDGVMPQTRESIDHAKAAGIPIIVAVNKIDLPGAKPESVKQALSEFDLLPEEWGGETLFVEVSAKEKQNLDKLIEAVLLQAEILDLKAKRTGPAEGRVLEARMEKGLGTVVTVLVQKGQLKKGDSVVCGLAAGKIRSLLDFKGNPIKEAGPSDPVEVLGLDFVPAAGDELLVAENEKAAKLIVLRRRELKKAEESSRSVVTLEDILSQTDDSEKKTLNIVLKSDVDGSLEAIKASLSKLSSEQVVVNFVSARTGGITESDILLATTSKSVVIGFNVGAEGKARKVAEDKGIQIKNYRVIYELIDDVKLAMEGLLDPDYVEKFLGRAEVRQLFTVPKIGVIAGSSVLDGKIVRNSLVRLLRDSKVIFEGKLSSLRRFKDDAKEVQSGYECGIGIENYNDLKTGDIIEAYMMEEVKQTLNF